MAERKVKWKVLGNILSLVSLADDKNQVQFNILDLFSNFPSFNDVQKFVVVYGVKQNLSDKFSAEKQSVDKLKAAKKRWEELKEGKVKAEGKSSLVTKITAQANVVSLEGLLSKKLLAKAKNEEFSLEDQNKLDEFLLRVTEG